MGNLLVAVVLYRREFCSDALAALRSCKVFEEPVPGKPERNPNSNS